MALSDFDLVLFGGSGDLSMRKLLPAMYSRDVCGDLPPTARIICVGRQESSQEEFINVVNTTSKPLIKSPEVTPEAWARFTARIVYVSLNATDASTYGALVDSLREDPAITRVYYLATPPAIFSQICDNLKDNGLVTKNSRVVLEKPLGRDLASAKQINAEVGQVFEESQIYRIDHYLGKETVQNLMALRFANALLEPVWRNSQVDHVQISVCETLGVENRGGYYDRAGATRDMLQNHLLQLLCLVAMEPPAQFEAEAVRDEKVKILRALKPIAGQDVQDKTVRGQYGAGRIGGQEVPAYYFEKDVDNDSDTETFVAVQAQIDNWRWAGVPFYLRTGKRMARRSSQIVIQFKPVPHELFNGGQVNQLLIQLQPEERISLRMMTKSPGKGMRLEPVDLDLNLAQVFGQARRWEAYERLLLDVLEGDSTLFMRRDEVEAAWAWIDPIIKGWEEHFQAPRPYAAGSNGPEQANSLLAHQGRAWHS